jgi:chromosome segregation ATPase
MSSMVEQVLHCGKWVYPGELQRTPATTPTALEVAERADELTIRRNEMRTKIAKRQLLERRCLELGQAIDEAERRKDALAEEHVLAASIPQAELKTIEDRLVACLAKREPTLSEDENRRKKLLVELADLNKSLEKNIAAEERLRGQAWNERRQIGMEVAQLPQESALIDLAPVHLRNRIQATGAIVRRLGTWRDSLRLDVERHPVERGRLQVELVEIEQIISKLEEQARALCKEAVEC